MLEIVQKSHKMIYINSHFNILGGLKSLFIDFKLFSINIIGMIMSLILFLIGITMIQEFYSIQVINEEKLGVFSGLIDTVEMKSNYDSIKNRENYNLTIKLIENDLKYNLNGTYRNWYDSVKNNIKHNDSIQLMILPEHYCMDNIIAFKHKAITISLNDYKKSNRFIASTGLFAILTSILIFLWSIKCLKIQRMNAKNKI